MNQNQIRLPDGNVADRVVTHQLGDGRQVLVVRVSPTSAALVVRQPSGRQTIHHYQSGLAGLDVVRQQAITLVRAMLQYRQDRDGVILGWSTEETVVVGRVTRPVGPCPCECNRGGFCGGCGHAGCTGGINL